KAWKNHLVADRTSCHEAGANQFRLFLHAGAYWLLWSLRRLMPQRSSWRVMQFDTLRLRLIKIAARVVELKRQIKIHLPSSAPDQNIFHLALIRLPRQLTRPTGPVPRRTRPPQPQRLLTPENHHSRQAATDRRALTTSPRVSILRPATAV